MTKSGYVAGHIAITTSVPFSSLEDLALILDVELLRIDADTTVRNFSRELRWNQAYHRLNLWL